jgi:hypothetical protein
MNYITLITLIFVIFTLAFLAWWPLLVYSWAHWLG